jgi:uncharacterized protein YndB with AHSA1/START domain
MMDGTLETIDGRPALRFERHLAHSVERVWRAVSRPEELERWFPAAAEWTPAAGETFEAGGMTGTVIEVEAPHRLAWTFNGEQYSFELTAHEAGCLLVFTHVFNDRTLAAQTAAGWEAYFSRLEPHLDGGFLPEEEAHQSWEVVHERYADRFGVDPTPGRRFIADIRADR